MVKYSVEKTVKIFDDESGDFISIGPEKDGLEDCVEISTNTGESVLMNVEQAIILAEQILLLYK